MYESNLDKAIEAGKKITLALLIEAGEHEFTALMVCTDKQMDNLINSGKWSEDAYSRKQDVDEEMRIMTEEAMEEFA